MDATLRTLAALRMTMVRGLGVRSANALLRYFKTPDRVFDSRKEELEAQGIPPEVGGDLLGPRSAERAQQEWDLASRLGIEIRDILHSEYPVLLREIYDPPIVLYIKGKKWSADSPQIALVGTRRPTGYGLNCAEKLGEDLAARGLVITSGLARGIDAAAHRGAVRTGSTYAVFGCGLDFVYPKENRKLAESVEESGALVSEFPLGTPPSPQNFPIRNRIIAGMSLGVTVVEAAEYSGSLITARLALEYNRDVFGVPGNVTSSNSFGPHALIRQGAKLVGGWQDIVEELPYPVREKILLPLLAEMRAAPQPQLDGVELKVWQLLSLDTPVAIDTLLAQLSSEASEIYGALLSLETSDLIRQLHGKRYIRRL